MTPQPGIYVGVVDDDEGARRSMVRLLTAAHFRPIAYDSAEEFLSDSKRPRFDCLVLDIQLGGISGIDLQRRLAAVHSTTPVIFVSANDDAQAREEAESVGCSGFLSKADVGEALIEAINRLVKPNAS